MFLTSIKYCINYILGSLMTSSKLPMKNLKFWYFPESSEVIAQDTHDSKFNLSTNYLITTCRQIGPSSNSWDFLGIHDHASRDWNVETKGDENKENNLVSTQIINKYIDQLKQLIIWYIDQVWRWVDDWGVKFKETKIIVFEKNKIHAYILSEIIIMRTWSYIMTSH